MRNLAVILPLAALLPLLAPSAAASPVAWAGQVTEHDEYVETNPIYAVRTSCTSTAAVGVLMHASGEWGFYTENDCLGYDVRFADDECDTDIAGVLSCYYADQNGSQHWLTFEPDGDFYTEYLSDAAFIGDNYVIEGNLAPVA